MASLSSVPRWTPSPSPTRPLRPRATAAAGDDIEMHGIDSPGGDEASFPFGYVPTTPPPLSPSPRHDDQLAKEEVGDESRGGARKVGGSERREQQGVFLTWEDLPRPTARSARLHPLCHHWLRSAWRGVVHYGTLWFWQIYAS
ncbi:unnamed protein product [Musa textilis]